MHDLCKWCSKSKGRTGKGTVRLVCPFCKKNDEGRIFAGRNFTSRGRPRKEVPQ